MKSFVDMRNKGLLTAPLEMANRTSATPYVKSSANHRIYHMALGHKRSFISPLLLIIFMDFLLPQLTLRVRVTQPIISVPLFSHFSIISMLVTCMLSAFRVINVIYLCFIIYNMVPPMPRILETISIFCLPDLYVTWSVIGRCN